ncbi:hypothetical protein D5086_010042 [Populus alba]|uniref:Uncharacterized protein n=1 Tax=Populus alba TaxID=43335 RepID=A0ACC4CAV4_POPAL
MKASRVLSINNVCWSYVISRVSSLRRIELMRLGSLLVFSPSSSSSILQGNSLPKMPMSNSNAQAQLQGIIGESKSNTTVGDSTLLQVAVKLTNCQK